MKKLYHLFILSFFLNSCNNNPHKEFYSDDKAVTQNFEFVRKKKYYLVITSIEKENNLVQLEKGDTIVIYKKELIFSNEKRKLVFNKKE